MAVCLVDSRYTRPRRRCRAALGTRRSSRAGETKTEKTDVPWGGWKALMLLSSAKHTLFPRTKGLICISVPTNTLSEENEKKREDTIKAIPCSRREGEGRVSIRWPEIRSIYFLFFFKRTGFSGSHQHAERSPALDLGKWINMDLAR